MLKGIKQCMDYRSLSFSFEWIHRPPPPKWNMFQWNSKSNDRFVKLSKAYTLSVGNCNFVCNFHCRAPLTQPPTEGMLDFDCATLIQNERMECFLANIHNLLGPMVLKTAAIHITFSLKSKCCTNTTELKRFAARTITRNSIDNLPFRWHNGG